MSGEAAVQVLTRESILAAKDAEVRHVRVPEWGGEVCVRALDARARDFLDSWQFAHQDGEESSFMGFRRRLVSLSLCNEEGTPLFQIEDAEGFEKAAAEIGRKLGSIVTRIADVAMDLNGMTAKGQEEAEGN